MNQEGLAPDGGALAKFFAKAVVKGFPGSSTVKQGAVDEVELANRIGEIIVETQVAGSSYIKAYVIDPEWALTISGWLKVKEGLLEPIEVEFPEGSKWFWVLCAVEGSTNVTEPNLIVTFEDRIVYYLRQYYGTKHVPPGTQTRAQFIRDLVAEVGQYGEEKAGFICPSLNLIQIVESEAEKEAKKTKTEQSKQEEEEEKAKRGGLGAGSFEIKETPATRQQALDMSKAIQTAERLKAPTKAVEALIIAGIGESTFEREASTSGHNGIWQSDKIPGDEVEKQAEYFLKGGESFQGGGAIKLAEQTKPSLTPGEIATTVEAGGQPASFYEVYLPEAQAIITESGGIKPSVEESVSDVQQLQRGTTANPDEDSFECATRLATQVDWFFFSDNHKFFYMDGPSLKKQKPALYVDIPRNHVKTPSGESSYGVITSPSTFTFDNCLALDTPIATPTGWTTMGGIKVGDEVFGSNGRPVKVVRCANVRHGDDCYEVKFRDGSSIIANDTHEWETYTVRTCVSKAISGKRHGKYTTEEIADSIFGYDKSPNPPRFNHKIKLCEPLELPEADLSVDPYVLGYWLGDGSHKAAVLTVGNKDLGSLLRQLESANYGYKVEELKPHRGSFEPTEVTWNVWFSLKSPWEKSHAHEDSIQKRLRSLGVWGNKHIPASYLRASAPQRLALLQGLMDSDGTISKHCCLQLGKRDLAEQAQEIVHTLGFRSTLSDEDPVGIGKLRRHRLIFASRNHVNVFRLPRKARQYAKRIGEKGDGGRAAFRQIVSVTPVPSVPVRCIEIDAEDHIFLAGSSMCRNFNTTYEYRISHKLKTRVQRKSKAVKPASPAEVKLLLECGIDQFHAGQVFKFENSGPIDGIWVITNTRREAFKNTYTEIILEPPIEPLPEPRGTSTNASEGQVGGATEQAQIAYAERSKYKYSEESNRNNGGTLFGHEPRTMDCSSFVTLCYKAAGLPDPSNLNYEPIGNTESLIKNCEKVNTPTKDDLCFYQGKETTTHPQHVTLYIGGGKAIGMEAPGVNLLEGGVKEIGPAPFIGYYRPKNY